MPVFTDICQAIKATENVRWAHPDREKEMIPAPHGLVFEFSMR